MALYTIKDTTLTALGDVVRSKVIGTSELPIITVEKKFIDHNTNYYCEMPSFVKKVKITGNISFSNVAGDKETFNPSDIYGTQGLGVAPGKFSYGSKVEEDEDYVIVWNGYSRNDTDVPTKIPFEIVIEDRDWTFVATNTGSSSPQNFDIYFTAIGLDENGNEFKYTPLEMVDAIDGLETVPDEALNLTGSCQYRFSYGSNDWLINLCGNKITTKDISNVQYMFKSTKVEEIPFEINVIDNSLVSYMFQEATKLKTFPQVNINYTAAKEFKDVFQSNYCMREIPEWFINILKQSYEAGKNNSFFGPFQGLFSSCYSLRSIPSRVMKYIAVNGKPNGVYYGVAYSKPFQSCYTLDELVGISCDDCSLTSNQFSSFFAKLNRANNITFETNEDGTPFVRQWKTQTLDLSDYCGWGSGKSNILDYNSGITADKQVTDDATYQALKNDPDWFTLDVNYSRYNHDSAVNTINSLPDCSATGTNTIKFKGAAGALTDGGAINTLTEAEIAVAAAKGWTVSLV